VGASWNDAGGSGAGRAYVYSGQTGSLLWTFTGEEQYGALGNSVSGAGDVNEDGCDDLIVGAPHWGYDLPFFSGWAYVYSGQTGDLLWTFTGEAEQDHFGSSVSGAGDVNNDGYDDLIVGAQDNDAGGGWAGRAYVYSGQTGALLQTFTGEAELDRFGSSVSGAGDVNNDGYDDLIVGAQANDAGGDYAGRAYVYSGQTGALLQTFTGEAGEGFGGSVSGAGDVNNDGRADLIVGAWGYDGVGRAYVYVVWPWGVLVTPGPDTSAFAVTDVAVKFFIQNTGVLTDVYDIDVTDSLGWNLDPVYYEVALDSGQVDSISVTVSVPIVDPGTIDRIFVTAVSQADTSTRDSASLLVTCTAYVVHLEAVTDVGNDQGRQVHVDWSSFPGGDPLVTDFSIFRRKGSLLISVPDKSVIEPGLPLTYPPGQWEWLATIPAFGETLYSAVVPTLKDSTIAEGMYWSVFFVRAGTDNPTLYYDSPVDSGYSLDNLSPSPPVGLIASHEPSATVLSWTGSEDADFDYYAVYRDTISGFDPDASNRLGYTIDTTLIDSNAELGRTYYYLASAFDFSGNESDPSNEAVGARYLTGDASADGIIDVGDVVYVINYLFKSGPTPNPIQAADANCDGNVDVADVVYLINYLFKGGPPPSC